MCVNESVRTCVCVGGWVGKRERECVCDKERRQSVGEWSAAGGIECVCSCGYVCVWIGKYIHTI